MSERPKQAETDAEAGGRSGASLEGTEAAMDSPAERERALRQAMDYRGDVTLQQRDGQAVVGFVYDLREAAGGEVNGMSVRVMLAEGGRMSVAAGEIERLVFSGKDTAAGKSFETWVKKYVKQKLDEDEKG